MHVTSGLAGWLLPVLLAPFIGSFLGVLILRLPEGRPVGLARSVCERCGHVLGLRDLVPLISYAWRRGRCRYCGEPIGWLALQVEIGALAVAVWAVDALPNEEIWQGCLLGWVLLAAAWTDLRTMILPDLLTLPLLAAGLVVTAVMEPEVLLDRGLGAAVGYLLLLVLAWAYKILRKRAGLGMGDAKLLGALGAWVGVGQLPGVLLMASCLGLAAACGGWLAGRRMTAATAIPFGPFLALAGWLSWLYGDSWNDWTARIFSG